MTSIAYTPIGVIRTPFTDPAGMPIQPAAAAGIRGTVEIRPDLADGLADLDGFSHVHLLYHFHRCGPSRLRVVPFFDTRERGVFATRAPVRPNAVGLSVVRLLAVRGTVLEVEGVDMLDGTPLIDVKPYVPFFDAPAAVSTGWLAARLNAGTSPRADRRFAGPSEGGDTGAD